MSFQSTVNRSFTTGFPGEIVRDGPTRAQVARIASAGLTDAPNRIGRVFGYTADLSVVGSGTSQTHAADVAAVSVGGATYFGVLGHPKHYVLYGSVANGSLGASYDLPKDSEGEFFRMATGIVVEIFNDTTAAKSIPYGASLAYVPVGISAANNPLGLAAGVIVAVNPGGTLPTGFIAIPNSKVINTIALAASSASAVVAGLTIVSLTE